MISFWSSVAQRNKLHKALDKQAIHSRIGLFLVMGFSDHTKTIKQSQALSFNYQVSR